MSTAVVERLAASTAGMELVTGDEVVALEATRHLFLAANLLDPARMAEIGLPDGGEELPNRCLYRTEGKLPKCEIVPLEFWGEPMPVELMPEGVKPMRLKVSEKKAPEPEGLVAGGVPNFVRVTSLPFMPVYPGELVVDALGIATGERRGVVEIKVLQGVNYGGYDRELQNLFFPPDFVKPVPIRLIRQRIEQVGDAHADADVKSAANDMILSCDQSEAYMQEAISVAQTQLATRRVHNYTYRLTPKIRSFMAQLEIKPPVDGMTALQDQVLNAVAGSGITPEILDQIMARQTEAMANMTRDIVREVMAQARQATPEPSGE